jgi:hypothetical protein
MLYPPFMRAEQRLDTYRNLQMAVYPWSAQIHSKLMSRVADLKLNTVVSYRCLIPFHEVHGVLMERYETFSWTQTIQFFQLIAE